MALITLKDYALKYFGEDSRPNYTTVWRWARQGHLPVKRIGKTLYVDTSKLDPSGLPTTSTNPLVNRVMRVIK
jgi:hypothetical protein